MTKRSVASAFLGIVMGVVLSASVYSVPSNSWDEKGLRHPTRFELSEGKETPTYEEVMTFYRQLAATYPKQLRVWEVGPTDAGIPLVAVVLAPEGDFDPENWQRDRKLVVLVNNGIHPGEPDGIDASMLLIRNAVTGQSALPNQTVLVVIPAFNVGGMRERSPFCRVDQNGPEEFGARGNSQNLDLNRDLMKADALETRSLLGLMERVQPDVLIDNHVSNGADYQHVMTLLTTQPDKLGGPMGRYLREELTGPIYARMRDRGWDMVPYVNHWGHTPEDGWEVFLEGGRFLSGYAALRGIFSYVPETHMLKPYKDRVYATLALNEELIRLHAEKRLAVKAVRDSQVDYWRAVDRIPVDWKVAKGIVDAVGFDGYRSGYKPSAVSGKPRLYYDRSKPYQTKVSFQGYAEPSAWTQVPAAWVVSGGWHDAVARLQAHGVEMRRLKRDTAVRVELCWVRNYTVGPQPYEGHFLLRSLEVERDTAEVVLRAGDWWISSDQPARRYLAEALEPLAPDGLLVWGFFNSILQQKEGYSDYVFEDTAAEWLKANPSVRAALEAKRATDSAFAEDGGAQLRWVFEQSPFFETRYRRVPVFGVVR
jgi:hypothetical protein